MQPQGLHISLLQIPPPIIEIILENKLSLYKNYVVNWDLYFLIQVFAYQRVCVLSNTIVLSIESSMIKPPS